MLSSNMDSNPVLLKFNEYKNHLGILFNYRFTFVSLAWGLKVSVSNKLPGDAAAAGPWTWL